jgi:CheY-like chemotaxis protein
MAATERASRALYRPLVLVVDDGKQHVTLLRLALMQRGYAVVVVHTAEGARTMVRERPVDAVLVTLDLAAATEILRDFGETRPNVAIAFAAPGDDGAARALAAGFDIALARPIDFAVLARFSEQADGPIFVELGVAIRHLIWFASFEQRGGALNTVFSLAFEWRLVAYLAESSSARHSHRVFAGG